MGEAEETPVQPIKSEKSINPELIIRNKPDYIKKQNPGSADPFKGKDGRYYETREALDAADAFWFEKMFPKKPNKPIE